jgi:hypothetical protein
MSQSRKEYMLERYHKRRAETIERLGGACIICGATENLELDHQDFREKSFNISQFWSYSKERYEAELTKIALLCNTCHKAKNTWERGTKAAIRTHGTLSSYRYCKCPICKKAYSDYWQKYKGRKKRPENKPTKIPGAYSRELKED